MTISIEAARATAKTSACQGCGHVIGEEDFVICTDGINGKVVTFHKRCQPQDPDLQRHHGVVLKPVHLGLTPKGLS